MGSHKDLNAFAKPMLILVLRSDAEPGELGGRQSSCLAVVYGLERREVWCCYDEGHGAKERVPLVLLPATNSFTVTLFVDPRPVTA